MSAAGTYPDGWFDEFWEHLDPDADIEPGDGACAMRLIGELFASEGIWRDGDHLVGRLGAKTYLTPDDQRLVRRIEQAVDHAREATGAEATS